MATEPAGLEAPLTGEPQPVDNSTTGRPDDAPRRTFWSAKRWRTGRKVGRTIYAQMGDEPSDHDWLIGVMDTPELAALVVRSVNGGGLL